MGVLQSYRKTRRLKGDIWRYKLFRHKKAQKYGNNKDGVLQDMIKRWPVYAIVSILFTGTFVFFNYQSEEANVMAEEEYQRFELVSSTFKEGGDIPKKHTCDDTNKSPQLSWGDPPAETKSFALLVEDPDAPGKTWTHWILFNLSPETRQLSDEVPAKKNLWEKVKQGTNDFGKVGYGGPCPPKGAPHRYFFRLYALDKMLNLKPGATRQELLKTMEGHILALGELMGRYQR